MAEIKEWEAISKHNWKTEFAGKFKICMPVFGVKSGRTKEVKVRGHFQHIAWLSKLPHSGMKFGIWNKFQTLHMDPLSTPWSRNCAYFYSSIHRPISKFPYLGMKSGIWRKVPKLHMYCLLVPQRVEIKLIFALRHNIRRQVPNLHIYSHSTPWGSKLSLFSLFSRYGTIFKTSIIGCEI